jgi:hypothetical protein
MRRPALDKALDGYAAEMAASRRQDLGQEVTVDALERAFTVSFTLDRLREAFRNHESCIAEQCTTRMPRTTVDPS